MSYCGADDLLLGDLKTNVNKDTYVNFAADEMDAELGQVYTLPLDLDSAPSWVASKLKKINSLLATGRLIMAVAAPAEDRGLHAYGDHLTRQALDELQQIVRGDVVLADVPLATDSFRATSPVVAQRDETSALDAFEDFVMRNDTGAYWNPGAL